MVQVLHLIEGTAFGYSASFRVLDPDWPAHFRYDPHDVVVDGRVLTVEVVHVHDTADFPMSNVCSACLRFPYLTPELKLPIDRPRMRPGRKWTRSAGGAVSNRAAGAHES